MDIFADDSLKKYLDDISRYPVLTRAQETTLLPAAQAGDSNAYDTIIQSNLRYVVKIALEYKKSHSETMELISEGNLGLFRALESFDPARGVRFITYAKWWIRQSVTHYLIYKSHVIRLPQSQLRKMRKSRERMESLEKEKGRSISDVEMVILEGDETASPVAQPIIATSLNMPVGKGASYSLLDILPDANHFAPDKNLEAESRQTELLSAFTSLKTREVDILKMLFGLEGGQRATLKQVGRKYAISSERVRQIKNAALEKLRAAYAREAYSQSFAVN